MQEHDSKDTYHDARIDDPQSDRPFDCQIGINDSTDRASAGHHVRSNNVGDGRSVGTRVGLDLGVRVGVGEVSKGRDNIAVERL